MAQIDARIEALELKLRQAKALKQKQQARAAYLAAKTKRKDETRRKVLAGAFVLDVMEREGFGAAVFSLAGRNFGDWLTRDDDRALFGLPPIQPQPLPAADQPQTFQAAA